MGVGWIAMVALLGRGWAVCLQAASGIELRPAQWLPLQLSAWSGRYLPGKIGLLAGKMQACEHGASLKQVTASVLAEQAAFVTAGLALSVLALPQLAPMLPAAWHASLNALASHTALLALLILLAGGLVAITVARRLLPQAPPGWAARLLGWSLAAHTAAGAGFHGLLTFLLDDALTLTTSIGLLAAAHTAGVLALFAPAGLGVREVIIASVLAPQLGWQQAVALTALQRGLLVLVDALLAATALAWQRLKATNN